MIQGQRREAQTHERAPPSYEDSRGTQNEQPLTVLSVALSRCDAPPFAQRHLHPSMTPRKEATEQLRGELKKSFATPEREATESQKRLAFNHCSYRIDHYQEKKTPARAPGRRKKNSQ